MYIYMYIMYMSLTTCTCTFLKHSGSSVYLKPGGVPDDKLGVFPTDES